LQKRVGKLFDRLCRAIGKVLAASAVFGVDAVRVEAVCFAVSDEFNVSVRLTVFVN